MYVFPVLFLHQIRWNQQDDEEQPEVEDAPGYQRHRVGGVRREVERQTVALEQLPSAERGGDPP